MAVRTDFDDDNGILHLKFRVIRDRIDSIVAQVKLMDRSSKSTNSHQTIGEMCP